MPAIVLLIEKEPKSSFPPPRHLALGCTDHAHIHNLLNCYQFGHIILPLFEGHNAEPFGVGCDRYAPNCPYNTTFGLLCGQYCLMW